MYIDNDMDILENVLTKNNTTRKSKMNSELYDPIYVKLVQKTSYFYVYSNKLMELMLSAFRWSGFPDSVNVRYFEKTLHYSGVAVITRYNKIENPINGGILKNGDLCSFRLGASKGRLDIYGEPLLFQVNGHDYQDTVGRDNAVIVYNNRLRKSSYEIINQIAFKLAEADMIISQNLVQQSNPYIITGSEESKKDLMALYRARANFVPVIVGSKNLSEDIKTEVQPTVAPFIVDKINTHKHTVWNEGMTFLGIDNANQEKRERMITGEINANDGQINLFRESMILQREEAVEEINKMFGLEVKVEYNNGAMDELAELFAQAQVYEKISETDLNLADAEKARSDANNSEEVL